MLMLHRRSGTYDGVFLGLKFYSPIIIHALHPMCWPIYAAIPLVSLNAVVTAGLTSSESPFPIISFQISHLALSLFKSVQKQF